jgi:hypothetical protein
MYIAGYVVECSLKALILARTPARRRAAMCEEISRGQRGHDVEYLKARLKQVKCEVPRDVVERLRRTAVWSTDWRYRVGLGEYRTAKEFLDATEYIRDWAVRSL